MTVAEISAIGLGSLMIPFPFAVDDHQTTNAQYLLEHGAAMLIQQKDLTVDALSEIISGLNRATCLTMTIKAKKLGKPNATRDVANICIEIAL